MTLNSRLHIMHLITMHIKIDISISNFKTSFLMLTPENLLAVIIFKFKIQAFDTIYIFLWSLICWFVSHLFSAHGHDILFQ